MFYCLRYDTGLKTAKARANVRAVTVNTFSVCRSWLTPTSIHPSVLYPATWLMGWAAWHCGILPLLLLLSFLQHHQWESRPERKHTCINTFRLLVSHAQSSHTHTHIPWCQHAALPSSSCFFASYTLLSVSLWNIRPHLSLFTPLHRTIREITAEFKQPFFHVCMKKKSVTVYKPDLSSSYCYSVRLVHNRLST